MPPLPRRTSWRLCTLMILWFSRVAAQPNLSARLPTVVRPLSPLDGQTLVVKNLVNPYYQRWSLGIQRSLPFSLVMDASYVGSKGTKLYINEDFNPLVPAALRITPDRLYGITFRTEG